MNNKFYLKYNKIRKLITYKIIGGSTSLKHNTIKLDKEIINKLIHSISDINIFDQELKKILIDINSKPALNDIPNSEENEQYKVIDYSDLINNLDTTKLLSINIITELFYKIIQDYNNNTEQYINIQQDLQELLQNDITFNNKRDQYYKLKNIYDIFTNIYKNILTNKIYFEYNRKDFIPKVFNSLCDFNFIPSNTDQLELNISNNQTNYSYDIYYNYTELLNLTLTDSHKNKFNSIIETFNQHNITNEFTEILKGGTNIFIDEINKSEHNIFFSKNIIILNLCIIEMYSKILTELILEFLSKIFIINIFENSIELINNNYSIKVNCLYFYKYVLSSLIKNHDKKNLLYISIFEKLYYFICSILNKYEDNKVILLNKSNTKLNTSNTLLLTFFLCKPIINNYYYQTYLPTNTKYFITIENKNVIFETMNNFNFTLTDYLCYYIGLTYFSQVLLFINKNKSELLFGSNNRSNGMLSIICLALNISNINCKIYSVNNTIMTSYSINGTQKLQEETTNIQDFSQKCTSELISSSNNNFINFSSLNEINNRINSNILIYEFFTTTNKICIIFFTDNNSPQLDNNRQQDSTTQPRGNTGQSRGTTRQESTTQQRRNTGQSRGTTRQESTTQPRGNTGQSRGTTRQESTTQPRGNTGQSRRNKRQTGGNIYRDIVSFTSNTDTFSSFDVLIKKTDYKYYIIKYI